MRNVTHRVAARLTLLLLLGAVAPLMAAAQGPRPPTLAVQGVDSASGQLIEIQLLGKAVSSKGRQFAGTCYIKPDARPGAARHVPSGWLGEWRLVQNSNPALAGGARPAVAGVGTRAGSKPLRPGQEATAAGQVINFTIEARPDGAYQVLLLDAFTDDSLEFLYPANPAGK